METAFVGAAMTILDPLQHLTTKVWAKVPSIFGALILLLLGSFIGRWLRFIAEKVIHLTRVDDYSEKVGFSRILNKVGFVSAPSRIVGFLVYWLVFLAFLLSAANVVQLTIVSEFLEQIVLFMPKLIAAVLVLGGGLFLSRFVSEVVLRAAQSNRLDSADTLARVSSVTLIVFSAIMALQCLGIDTSILSRSIQIIIGAIGLGVGLAFGVSFGLAGKDFAGRWLERYFGRRNGSDAVRLRKAA